MGAILEAIWNLPWYKVIIIAIVDDCIVLVKLWPLWALIIVIIIVMEVCKSRLLRIPIQSLIRKAKINNCRTWCEDGILRIKKLIRSGKNKQEDTL